MLNVKKNNDSKYLIENISKCVFLASALIAVISLLLIICFVFYKGLTPFISKGYSFKDFLFGTKWIPSSDKFGILPMVLASIFGTIFIAEIAPKRIGKIISGAVELLAGIPSVLYGVFGLAVIVPWIMDTFNLPKGQSLLAIIIVLSVMMLPTIVTVSETAIRAVPKSYKEGSLALGASHIETTFKVVVPAAKSGTLTTNIALEMGYAFGTHQEMLFATGIILFLFILLLNLVLSKLSNKEGK